ncbi:hypothetical protein ACFL47_04730 [Candidatus Latescibacterota bacterium]
MMMRFSKTTTYASAGNTIPDRENTRVFSTVPNCNLTALHTAYHRITSLLGLVVLIIVLA